MTFPREFYGNRATDETLRLECGPRVVTCYDEAFAIEGRMIRAGLCNWSGERQSRWMRAHWEYANGVSTPECEA